MDCTIKDGCPQNDNMAYKCKSIEYQDNSKECRFKKKKIKYNINVYINNIISCNKNVYINDMNYLKMYILYKLFFSNKE